MAKRYLEYANFPIMEERKKIWYKHNSLQGDRPVIVMEMETFKDELFPSLKCQSGAAREIEQNLLKGIVNYELINDDKVISPFYTVFWEITMQQFGLEIGREYGKTSDGKLPGYKDYNPISDIKKDFSKLKPSTFEVDKKYTGALKNFIEETIGDILEVKIRNKSLYWGAALSMQAVKLMGLENMMYAMVDYPKEMHALYRFLLNDTMSFIKWQEKEGLLVLNNENDFVGSGSYGFSMEIPTDNYKETGNITPADLWLNLNSQETVGISPAMFGEFVFPYYYEIAKEFGMLYYGCCEPVHNEWNDYISKLPGLRKVSISPWCDEEYMGKALRDSNVIYSRKPSPNYIGVGRKLDEDAFSAHIKKTLSAAKGCKLEFIFRDIYTLSGDVNKPGKAVNIVRGLIEKLW